MKMIRLFLILVFLAAVSCDSTSDLRNGEIYESHFFSFELIDEHGKTVEFFSNEKAGDVEIEQSAGLFGDNFIPPELVDLITSSIPVTPEQLRRDQIYLHAEREIEGAIHHVTLMFNFPNQDEWTTGSKGFIEQSEEFLIERFRLFWEFRRGLRDPDNLTALPVGPGSSISPPPGQQVVANYIQMGFGDPAEAFSYSFFSLGGVLHLDEVTDKHIKGNFSLELLGLPANLYQLEEFPEELETLNYIVTGEFVALHGNYEDLRKMRADLGFTYYIF